MGNSAYCSAAGAVRTYGGARPIAGRPRRGARGEISARVWPLREVERVIACTDGLLPEIDAVVGLSDEALDARLGVLAAQEDSDDMAFVDVALTSDAMPPVSGGPAVAPARAPDVCKQEAPPDELDHAGDLPASPEWVAAGRGDGLAWRPVEGADGYMIQFAAGPEFDEPVTYEIADTSFVAPDLGSATWARVRAQAGGRDGPWGEPRALERGALPAPTGLRVRTDGEPGGLELSWDAVAGAEGYVIRVNRSIARASGRPSGACRHHAPASGSQSAPIASRLGPTRSRGAPNGPTSSTSVSPRRAGMTDPFRSSRAMSGWGKGFHCPAAPCS